MISLAGFFVGLRMAGNQVLQHVRKDPFCVGVYAYGDSENRTTIIDGHARKSCDHCERPGLSRGYLGWA
jgi:hypothetical protein